jgi:hypothetical protein
MMTFHEFRINKNGSLDMNEDLKDFFGSIGSGFSSIATSIGDVFKAKVTAYLLSMLGINEDSIFSKLVQNFIEQIPVTDYFIIIFQGKAKAGYLAPKAADATMEFLVEMGLDGIAEKLGIDNKGLIYKTISELFSNQVKREQFRKSLEKFYLEAFTGFQPESQDQFAKNLTPSERSKMESALQSKSGQSEKSGNMVDDFLSRLSSLSTGGAKEAKAFT